jgi:hypothetical protein
MAMSKVSVLLNGGVDEQASTELGGPVASQGASLTLRASRNTRLSERRGTCVRAPYQSEGSSLSGGEVHGMVSAAAGRNVVTFRRPGQTGNSVLTAEGIIGLPGTGQLVSPLDPTLPQNSYIPCQITRAGAVPSAASLNYASTCLDHTTGYIWTAYLAYTKDGSIGGGDVFVTVSDQDGAVIAPPVVVFRNGATQPWLGLTAHGASGVRIWYSLNTQLMSAALTLVDTVVVSGTVMFALTINAGAAMGIDTGLTFGADGVADSTFEQYAYVTTERSGAPFEGKVHRIDVNTYAVVTSPATFLSMGGGGSTDIVFEKIDGAHYVGVGWNGYTGDYVAGAILNPTTLAVINFDSTSGGADRFSDTAVQFLSTPALGTHLIVANSYTDGSFDSLTYNGCILYSLPMTTNVLTQRMYIPWMGLSSTGATIRFADDELYPLFDMVPRYGIDAQAPDHPDHVVDPSVTVYLIGDLTSFTPVARYGCVRFTLAPAYIGLAMPLNNSTLNYGTKLYATYLKDTVGSSLQTDHPVRFVELDFAPFQPPVAHDKDGSAYVAAALPVQWDGTEIVEMGGPLYAPHITINAGAGTGDIYPVGAYSMACVYTWHDASGLEHRTAPAVVNFTGTGTPITVYITGPVSMRDGERQSTLDAFIYTTETNGATAHLLPERPFTFANIVQLAGDLSYPDTALKQLYSRGTANEEQTPQPPPPAHDIAIIGDRCWILDAEMRSRVVHSKHRIAGVGFEFHPAYEIVLPAGAGRTMAVREWQGSVVVFTEYAIYGISGSGPDNLVGNPSGGSFSAPQLLAYVGTTSRESVIQTPAGIYFQRGSDFFVFAGGQPTALQGVQPETPVSGATLLRNQDEVAFLVDGEWKVHNYALNRWTMWDAPALGSLVHPLGFDPGATLIVGSNDPDVEGDPPQTFYSMDAETLSYDADMSWETDWVVLGGDFQDSVLLHETIFSARWGSAHGITVEVFTNYEESESSTGYTSRSWTETEILGLLGGYDRYTLHVSPQRQDTKAIKVRITEAAPLADPEVPYDEWPVRHGVAPICLTFRYTVQAQVHEASRIQGSYK